MPRLRDPDAIWTLPGGVNLSFWAHYNALRVAGPSGILSV
jgi:hypothetical protein